MEQAAVAAAAAVGNIQEHNPRISGGNGFSSKAEMRPNPIPVSHNVEVKGDKSRRTGFAELRGAAQGSVLTGNEAR